MLIDESYPGAQGSARAGRGRDPEFTDVPGGRAQGAAEDHPAATEMPHRRGRPLPLASNGGGLAARTGLSPRESGKTPHFPAFPWGDSPL